MSTTLSGLLNESDKSLSKIISKLEALSGHNSEDIRLLMDLRAGAGSKLRSLGLDPADTTGEELYHTLQSKLRSDSLHLARALNFKETDDIDTCLSKLVGAVSYVEVSEVLALKHAVAKDLLRKNPPKKLMKHLNYRSLESMLKREDVGTLYAGAPLLESGAWLKKFSKSASKLKASDFEMCRVSFIAMPSKRWSKVATRPVSDVALMGTVAAWPIKLFAKRESLYCSLTLLQAAEILETDSFYLKTNQFNPNFGKLVSGLAGSGELQPLEIDDQAFFSWGHLRKALEDYDEPLTKLAGLHPSLRWWKDSHNLALLDDGPVSMNLGDNLKSLLSGADYKRRHSGSYIHRLKSELLGRYAQYEGVKNYLQSQFDDTFIAMDPAYEPALEIDNIN